MKRFDLMCVAFLIVGAMALPQVGWSGVIFHDDFESGGIKSTNADGFAWSGSLSPRIAIARSDGYLIVDDRGAVSGPHPSRQYEGFESDHALHFLYPANESWTEKRFSLGAAYPDLWIRFHARVPINFKHRNSRPSNNKLFAIWMDDYENKGDGATVVWNYWHDGYGGSELAFVINEGGRVASGGQSQHFQFIDDSLDRGRWMEIVIHVKASTSPSSYDGVVELFRRWQGESNFIRFHEKYDAKLSLPANGPAGWSAGYLLGWSNPGFDSDTEWLIDNFTLSSEPLVDGSMLSNPPSKPRIRYIERLD